MKIINAGYEILTPMSDYGFYELKLIEKIGRVCYKSENNITETTDSAERFIKMLINNGHEAMLEHSSLSVKFTVDRGVTHELVRHRIASFAQESTRYCNYGSDKFGNEITVIKPLFFDENSAQYKEWKNACEQAEKYYFNLINLGGSKPEEARTILPTSTKAEITVTANYREWRNIFKLRCDKPAHPQIREVMIPLLHELQDKIPVVFDDLKF